MEKRMFSARTCYATILLVFTVAPAFGEWEWRPDLYKNVLKANALEKEGNPEAAVNYLNQLLENTEVPLEKARLHRSLADLHHRNKHYDEARISYELALSFGAVSPNEEFEITKSVDDEYSRTGSHAQALALLQEYLKRLHDKEATTPQKAKGEILSRIALHSHALGDVEAAILSIEAAITSTDKPEKSWLEQRAKLFCTNNDAENCIRTLLEYAKTGYLPASKAEELDEMLSAIVFVGRAQQIIDAAKTEGLVADNMKIVKRLPQTYIEAIPIATMKPSHPKEAKEKNLSGYVDIDFIVNPDGSVSDAKIIASSPSGVFDTSALAAIAKWRFRPKFEGGKPLSARTITRIQFGNESQ